MAKTNTMSMMKSIPTEQSNPFELTEIGVSGSPGFRMYSIRKNKSHGTGRPTQTSKILDPTELDTAMSPSPFRATMTLVIKSGILVPAAKIVNPIISVGITKVSPIVFAHQTIKYEKNAIHPIDNANVTGYQVRL